jgi:hypothetical protein
LTEIGDRLAFPLQQPGFDMDVQHIARPAVFEGAPGIGEAGLGVFQLGQQHQVVAPGQLSNSLLDNFGIRPGLGEGAHVHQVGAGKALHVGKGGAQVMGQALDDLGAPALLGLAPRMSRPICQYSSTSSRFTASAARCWAVWMRALISASHSA